MNASTYLRKNIFKTVAKQLRKANIPYWLDGQTLLEILGEKNGLELQSVPHLEISIPGEYYPKLMGLKNKLLPFYRLKEVRDLSGRKWIPGDTCKVAVLSMFRNAEKTFKVYITLVYEKDGRSRWVDRRSCKHADSKFFNNLGALSFGKNNYPVPGETENYLAARFGDWRKPNHIWVSRIDDLAIADDGLIATIEKKAINKITAGKIKLEHGNNHERMKKMLLETIDILAENKIKFWLEAGTLLGIVRDGDLIPWDYDADIGIVAEDAEKVLKLRNKFLPRYLVKKKTVFTYWLPKDTRVVKIKTAWEKLLQINFHVDLFCLYRVNGEYRWVDSNALKKVDAKFYDKLDTISWEGREVPIPAHAEDYLELRYGNWKTPDPNFDSGHQDGSIAERGF